MSPSQLTKCKSDIHSLFLSPQQHNSTLYYLITIYNYTIVLLTKVKSDIHSVFLFPQFWCLCSGTRVTLRQISINSWNLKLILNQISFSVDANVEHHCTIEKMKTWHSLYFQFPQICCLCIRDMSDLASGFIKIGLKMLFHNVEDLICSEPPSHPMWTPQCWLHMGWKGDS